MLLKYNCCLISLFFQFSNFFKWGHQDNGTVQVNETLLNTANRKDIKKFLENYLSVTKIGRNDKCYCGGNKKLKNCHYEVALFLKSTPKKAIEKDIALFD